MQTFCTEGLTVPENISVFFKPDYKPTLKQRTYTFESFLTVLLEMEEQDTDQFVKQYLQFTGVHYPTKEIGNIQYHTGTRVYRCTKIKKHHPKSVHIFGRWVKVIDNGQLARQKPTDTIQQQEIRQIEYDTEQLETTNQKEQPPSSTKSFSPKKHQRLNYHNHLQLSIKHPSPKCHTLKTQPTWIYKRQLPLLSTNQLQILHI